MQLGVLGPLHVHVGAQSFTPTAPKMRNVLATLMVHSNQVIPVSWLMRELWGEDPPASSTTTVQTYILNLRKLLAVATGRPSAEIAAEVLVTHARGYSLQLHDSTLDMDCYQELVRQGRQALSDGDDDLAAETLNLALQQWRGPALLDVPAGPLLESRRRELEESRLVVLEYLFDVKLRLGMYREVLTELAALTVENPLHEGLHTQYMRALHLSGRRAQALQVFHRVRANLVNEIGLEPGRPVQELHQAILNSEHDFDSHLVLSRPRGEIVRAARIGPHV